MDLKITIRGVKESMNELEREITRIVDNIADDTIEVAKRNTPIDKGRARQGWRLDKAGDYTRIGAGTYGRQIVNSVPYAVHLEEGHSKQAPRGILGPTVAEIARRRYR